MRTIFLDTVGMIALWDKRDQWHDAARRAWATLDPDATRFITTSFALLECANHAARKPYRMDVVRLRDDLGLSGDLYEPTPEEADAAWEKYANSGVGSPGVVDLTSFAIMRRLGITEAFTNDAHFTSAGYSVLF
jgi:predicted nucleic acid-binding protein